MGTMHGRCVVYPHRGINSRTLSDVYEDNPNGTIVKAFACVNEANANANASITIADSVKTALKLIPYLSMRQTMRGISNTWK